MKVFISWSGDLSHKVAKALHQWLKLVVQATDPWISSEGIDKGTIWFSEVSDQLASTSAGIVCLANDNLEAPWILFEAGALAKGLTKNRVYTLLIDVTPSDLKPPLSQFNATLLNEEDMLRLLRSINAGLGEQSLPEDVLRKAFEAHWPQLVKEIEALRKAHKPKSKTETRSVEDMAREILETSRATYTAVQGNGRAGISSANVRRILGSSLRTSDVDVATALSQMLSSAVNDDPFLKMEVREGIRRLIRRLEREPIDVANTLGLSGRT
jgi:hypothetical protein